MLGLGNAGPHGDPNQVIDRVAAILAKNDDQDAALRHGGIMALAGMRISNRWRNWPIIRQPVSALPRSWRCDGWKVRRWFVFFPMERIA